MDVSKVYFTSEDNLKLTGLLYNPDGKKFLFGKFLKPNKVVIFIHGMYSNCLRKRDDIFAEELNKKGISYFTFNNRGAEIANLNREKVYGTAFENPFDGGKDIEAAIRVMEKEGFHHVYLLGHSLGCSKILNWYPKRIKNVEKIGLLSLTALSDKYKQLAGDKAYKFAIAIANLKVSKGKGENLLPEKLYPRPISANTFLSLFDEDSEFNSVFYEDEEWRAENINSISEPLFIRYGTVNETITKSPEDTIKFLRERLRMDATDIGYIEGADHSYHGKEKEVIDQYIKFLNRDTSM